MDYFWHGHIECDISVFIGSIEKKSQRDMSPLGRIIVRRYRYDSYISNDWLQFVNIAKGTTDPRVEFSLPK